MIHFLKVGSQLYGLTNSLSDTDYLVILTEGDVYPFPEDKEIEVWTHEEFKQKLLMHDLRALEAYFGYPELFKEIVPATFAFSKDSLRRSVSGVSSNAHVKAKKKFKDGEIYVGLKSYWHSYRILVMYTDLAKNGIFNPRGYSEQLKSIYEDIISRINDNPLTMFKELNETHMDSMKEILHEFRLLCPLDQEK